MSIAVLKIAKKSITEIIEQVRKVVLMMTGNATFTTPVPPLADITNQTDELETNYQDALKGDRDKKALMRISLKTLKGSLTTLTGYVQGASNSDEAKILSAGFDVKSPRNPVGILLPPDVVKAVFGKLPGQVILRWNGVKGRLVYKVQVNDDPGNLDTWKDYTYIGKNRVVVTGLISRQVYEFRIAVISASGIGNFSNPVSQQAL